MGASISPKETWTARGALVSPQAAIDGKLTTIAHADDTYHGAELTIDLKAPCLFQTVIIDHGRKQHGYCRRAAVATSLDGEAFVERYQAPGTRRVTILSLPEPVLARYVRIRAVRAGEQAWSIAEVFLQ